VLSYLIAYDPAMRPIGIARVLHASRDLEALLHRSPSGLSGISCVGGHNG